MATDGKDQDKSAPRKEGERVHEWEHSQDGLIGLRMLDT